MEVLKKEIEDDSFNRKTVVIKTELVIRNSTKKI